MRMSKKIRQDNYFNKINISSDVLLDSLTRVINRRYIMSYLTYLVNKKIPFSMAILDIDNFKVYNDTYGHMIGDKILVNFANTVCDNCSDDCYVGRYGGDEFVVIYQGDDSYDTCWNNLKRIFVAVRKTVTIDSFDLNITCTAGAAAFPKDGSSLEEIFNKSDRTLYRGKLKGRNCFVIYVREKHQDLQYVREERLPIRMNKIYDYFRGEQDIYFEIYEALLYMVNDLKTDAAGLFEINKPPLLYKTDVEHNINRIPEDALEEYYNDDLLVINERGSTDVHSRLRAFMEDYNIRAMAACKLVFKGEYLGYVMLYHERIRVWQNDDMALLKYLATIISMSLYYNKNKDED